MKYDFCNFKNGIGEAPSELYFYGDIVSNDWLIWAEDDQCPLNVSKLLKEIGDNDVDIHINSCGGDVFAGITIGNLLSNTKGRKRVFIDGICASIASVIAMAGDEIIIPENATFMIHRASVSLKNVNANECLKTYDLLCSIDDKIVNSYMRHAKGGVTAERFLELMTAESWLSAAECSELFDNITVCSALSASAKLSCEEAERFKNAPERLKSLDPSTIAPQGEALGAKNRAPENQQLIVGFWEGGATACKSEIERQRDEAEKASCDVGLSPQSACGRQLPLTHKGSLEEGEPSSGGLEEAENFLKLMRGVYPGEA